MAAKKKPLEILNPKDLLPELNPAKALSNKYIRPEKRKGGQILKGLSKEQVIEKILEFLKEKGKRN